MRATKLFLNVKHLPYKERLVQLKLPTLKYRRLRGDMINILKLLTGKNMTPMLLSVLKNIKIVEPGGII